VKSKHWHRRSYSRRAVAKHLGTFAGDPLIDKDSVMRGTPEEPRHLLITSATEDEATGLPLHRFDIVLGQTG
jgi:hypothetical protein